MVALYVCVRHLQCTFVFIAKACLSLSDGLIFSLAQTGSLQLKIITFVFVTFWRDSFYILPEREKC